MNKILSGLSGTLNALVIVGVTGSAIGVHSDEEVMLGNGSQLLLEEAVVPMSGHVSLCIDRPDLCEVYKNPNSIVELTPENIEVIQKINLYVNQKICSKNDSELYVEDEFWDIVDIDAGEQECGDCEDFVLTKKAILTGDLTIDDISLSEVLPKSAFSIVVVTHNEMQEGHAVLAINTNQGHIILNNLTDEIIPVDHILGDYTLHYAQSTRDASVWHSAVIERSNDEVAGMIELTSHQKTTQTQKKRPIKGAFKN